MVIRGRAPLRISFGGGGTDVEPFCVEQGGAIIGSTINKYAYCSIVPREDDQIQYTGKFCLRRQAGFGDSSVKSHGD